LADLENIFLIRGAKKKVVISHYVGLFHSD
jgi:hypothetical protein